MSNTNIGINISANGAQAQQVLRQITAALRLLQRQQSQGTAANLAGAGAASRAGRAHQSAVAGINAHSNALAKLQRRIVSLGTVYAGGRLFAGFIREGLKFNEVIETAEVGIASIITATSNVRDPFGNLQQGAAALNTAVNLAKDQITQLRIAGLQTAATTDELVQAYQSAVAAGIGAGLNLDEIRKVTVQIVQAAGSIGLPMQQLEQEVRSILQATIDRNSRVARVLGITNEQVRLMREQGRLAEFLNTRLQAFTTAGEKAATTFRVIKSNMQEALQVFSGVSTEPLFESLARAGQNALSEMFNLREARISDRFQPIVEALQVFFDEFGSRFELAIEGVLDRANALSEWLVDNRVRVQEIVDAFFDMAGAVAGVVRALLGVGGAIVNLFTQGEGALRVFRSIEAVASLFAGVLDRIAAVIDAIGDSRGARALAALTLTVISVINPAAGATIALYGMAAAMANLMGKERQLAAEEEARTKVLVTNTRLTSQWVREILRLNKSISESDSALERNELLDRRKQLLEQLVEISPAYAKILDDETKSYEEQTRAVISHTQALIHEQTVRLAALRLRERTIEAETGAFHDQRRLDRIRLQELDDQRKRELKTGFVQGIAYEGKAEREERKRINERLRERPIERAAELRSLRTQINEGDRMLRQYERIIDAAAALGSVQKKATDPDTLPGGRSKQDNDLRQRIMAQIEMEKKAHQTREEVLKAALERNELSYEQYYVGVQRSLEYSVERQLDLYKELYDGISDAGEKAQIKGEVQELGEELAKEHVRNREGLRKDLNDLNNDILNLDIRFMQISGQAIQAASSQAIQEMKDFRARLEAEGRLTADMEAKINALINRAGVDAATSVVQEKENRLRSSIDSEMLSIDLARQTRAATEEELNQRVVKVYERQLMGLRDIREEFARLNLDMSDPKAREQMQALELEIQRLEIALEQARNAANILRRTLIESGEAGIETLLATGIQDAFQTLQEKHGNIRQEVERTADAMEAALEAQGMGVQERTDAIARYIDSMRDEMESAASFLDVLREAFRSFAASVVSELQRVVAQMIAFRIMQAAIGVFAQGSSAASAMGDFVAPAQVLAATGGYITGPGTGTSDSIPARLSHGEYVLSAAAVKGIGVDALDQINFGRSMPRVRRRGYATGGEVVAPAGAAGSGGFDATLGLEEGLVLRHLNTRGGTRTIVGVISENRKAIRAALGL